MYKRQGGQEPDGAFHARQEDRDGGSLPRLAGQGDGAAVFLHDAAHDEQAQAGAGGFGGQERFINAAHDFRGNAAAGIRHGDEHAVIRITAFNQNGASLRRDGLVGVFDQVVEDLLDLDGVQAEVCLLYTSDAADDLLWVDLGGRQIIKKKQ